MFKAEEWDNFGLFTVNSSLIYSIIDVLLGGRRGQTAIRIEGRPYTTIETNLVKRMIEVVLADAEQAFRPLSPVHFNIDRLETNPRFAAISRPANAAILVRLRIDMEDRGGTIELLLPYATIEPIRDVLLQMFMGEKFGRDPIWEGHLATEIGQADDRRRSRAVRSRTAAEAADVARSRRHADARAQARRAGHRALRRRHADRRPHGPRRRPRRGARRQAAAQAENHLRHVRDGGPILETGWRPREQRHFGLMIESLVAVLLLLTIGFCIVLNSRLKKLKADEQALKGTISELITATEIAERAIAGLKMTVRDCDQNLSERLRAGEGLARELGGQLDGGRQVLAQLAQITLAARASAASRQRRSCPTRRRPRRPRAPSRRARVSGFSQAA